MAAASLGLALLFLGWKPAANPPGFEFSPKQNLSEYGFFAGELAALNPAANVHPFEVNAPLFSDYAEKSRFIFLPPDTRMAYARDRVFDFPAGAVLIKNFYYSHDQRRPELGRRLLETRLILKTETGVWKALAYVWNAAQTDATLEVAGANFPVNWTDAEGKKRTLDYLVPNLNQCKNCHARDGIFAPIGLTARQLNRSGQFAEGVENQLIGWGKMGLLDSLPDGFSPDAAPRLADPFDEHSGDLNARARAYLDANCGHCHAAHGAASTSGMFLDIFEKSPERLGIGKAPVAAGRGSGDRQFGIVPGKPERSILPFRMENDDPGIRMPELGRQLPDRAGIELVKNWIRGL